MTNDEIPNDEGMTKDEGRITIRQATSLVSRPGRRVQPLQGWESRGGVTQGGAALTLGYDV